MTAASIWESPRPRPEGAVVVYRRLLADAAYPRFASRDGRAALAVTCRETKRVVVREWTEDLGSKPCD